MSETVPGEVGLREQTFGSFSKLPSSKIFQNLSISDTKNCRLVCREWNLAATEFLNFAVQLSDMTILPFLRIRRNEEPIALNVVKIIAADLSALSAPFTPEALQEQVKCPKNMKTLRFLEGVTPVVKQNFLLAFKWIHTLKFEKTPLPTFPSGLILEHLTKFEMSPGAYNESDELKIFFLNVHFPSLSETDIQIHCRSDYHLYAAVHYFAARHNQTIKILKLLFLESLTNSCYDHIFAKDFREIILQQKRDIEQQKEYQKFLSQLSLLQLTSLSLWLIDNEEFLEISLKLIDAQHDLQILEISRPYNYRDINTDFSLVFRNNCRTLKKVTIPRLPQFDCSILKDCVALEEFSLGMEFHFYDYKNYGQVINIQGFPSTAAKLKSISMGSPMSKDEIYWLMNHMKNCHTFLFIGSQQQDQEYSLMDVTKIVECGPIDKKTLMMCIPMSYDTFQQFQVHLSQHSEISVDVIYHCRPEPNQLTLGTAHFSISFEKQLHD